MIPPMIRDDAIMRRSSQTRRYQWRIGDSHREYPFLEGLMMLPGLCHDLGDAESGALLSSPGVMVEAGLLSAEGVGSSLLVELDI